MKKYTAFMTAAAAILCVAIIAIGGCAGTNVDNADEIVNTGLNVGLYLALKNNPEYVQPTVEILEGIKIFAQGEVSYNDLIAFAQDKFDSDDDDLAAIALIVGQDLFTEEPIINSIPIFDGYREDLIARIDGLLMAASLVK
ncbi:MAG: hypothetical protein JW884_14175 [Deltaproteobacteria bacterium]|nr:hypothetical protein [Deltaproteobacteria bacterium]